MRETAADAQIVIVNHHLLCADASVRESGFGEVIPECDYAIVDEAHQLEDVVTQYFGVSVSTHRVDEFVRDISSATSSIAKEEGALAVSIVNAAHDIQHTCRRLFDAARLELRQRDAGDRAALTPEGIGRLNDVGIGARDAIDRLLSRLKTFQEPPEDLKTIGRARHRAQGRSGHPAGGRRSGLRAFSRGTRPRHRPPRRAD
jgi:ATP-dependent DNA helicase DinG